MADYTGTVKLEIEVEFNSLFSDRKDIEHEMEQFLKCLLDRGLNNIILNVVDFSYEDDKDPITVDDRGNEP